MLRKLIAKFRGPKFVRQFAVATLLSVIAVGCSTRTEMRINGDCVIRYNQLGGQFVDRVDVINNLEEPGLTKRFVFRDGNLPPSDAIYYRHHENKFLRTASLDNTDNRTLDARLQEASVIGDRISRIHVDRAPKTPFADFDQFSFPLPGPSVGSYHPTRAFMLWTCYPDAQYTVSSSGQTMTANVDTDDDGTDEARMELRFQSDEQKRPTQWSMQRLGGPTDDSNKNIKELTGTFAYNPDGKIDTVEWHSSGSFGLADLVSRSEFVYEEGELRAYRADTGGDGDIDTHISYAPGCWQSDQKAN